MSDPAPVQDLSPDALRVGLQASFERHLTEDDVLAFARVSGDINPLHVDAEYGASSRFGERIAHGALQVGLASAMIGTRLPGARVLLGSLDARFPAPLTYPRRVRVTGEIIAWNPATGAGRLRVRVEALPEQTLTADVGMAFTMRGERETQTTTAAPQPATPATTASADRDAPLVLLTGASGGIGSALARALRDDYRILAGYRSSPADLDRVEWLALDLTRPDWAAALPTGPLYAIVHAAWPGMPRGGLLGSSAPALQSQLDFGTHQMIALGQLLAERAPSSGGRLIALGSIVGGQRPNPSVAAYSLGKAALEHTARLLAPELARKGVTVNVIAPGFVPVGINRAADERRRKLEAAQTPLGRVATIDDIVGTVRWLLSADAGFVSGQIVGLTGAQL